MKPIYSIVNDYLIVCQHQRNLSPKTVNAYSTDIGQYKKFSERLSTENAFIQQDSLERYLQNLHIKYQPKTVKRKIASLKALFKYMYLKNIIQTDPWEKIQYHFKEALILPKTIPLHVMKELFSILYTNKKTATSNFHIMRATKGLKKELFISVAVSPLPPFWNIISCFIPLKSKLVRSLLLNPEHLSLTNQFAEC